MADFYLSFYLITYGLFIYIKNTWLYKDTMTRAARVAFLLATCAQCTRLRFQTENRLLAVEFRLCHRNLVRLRRPLHRLRRGLAARLHELSLQHLGAKLFEESGPPNTIVQHLFH